MSCAFREQKNAGPKPVISEERRRFSGILLLCVLVLVSCTSTPTPAPTSFISEIRVAYSDSTTTLMDILIPVYGDEHPGVNLETNVGNTVSQYADLINGSVDALLVPGFSPIGELERSNGDASSYWASVVALDGLALIVNPSNPITGLTKSQVKEIFAGSVWSWEMVGGWENRITVVTRETGSAARDLFQELVMDEQSITPTAVVLTDTDAVIAYIAMNPAAIAYIATSGAEQDVKLLALEGSYPTPATFMDQNYPLTFPIYLVTLAEPQGALREFAAWIMSRDGQALVSQYYGNIR